MSDRRSNTPPSAATNKEIQWKFWVWGIAVLLLLIIVLQNSQDVRFKLLFIVDTSAPLVFLLLLAAVLGAIIGYTAPILRRHRYKTRKEYKED